MAKLVRDRPGEARMEYLKHAVDAEAAAAFEQLGVEQQELVLSQVDFSRCRNVSAFIWSRVKALNGHSAGGMGAVGVHPRTALTSTPLTRAVLPGGGGGKPGGQDRSRIRSRSPAALTGGWAGAPGALPQAVTQEDPVIAAFVQQARLDGGALEALMNLGAEAAAALERLGAEQQEFVLSQVDVSRCRNVSAFIWSRVKALNGHSTDGMVAVGAPPRAAQAPTPPMRAVLPWGGGGGPGSTA